nr:hypothetical protein GCM10020185_56690 [Pseudomonas brassicacearum subsp. brassicacearum]
MSVAMFMVMTSAGRPSITERACLLEPPNDICTVMFFVVLGLPVLLEGCVVVLVEIAHHVVGNVEQGRGGVGQAAEGQADGEK